MDRLHLVHSIITDCWKNYKERYETMADTNEWWNATVESWGEIAKKYKDDKVVIDVAVTLMNDLERICKTRRKNNAHD